MCASLHCTSGKVRFESGDPLLQRCQDCNGYHDSEDQGDDRNKSIRNVAFMLHNDEITPRDAALILFILTDPIPEHIHFHHD